MQLSDSLFCRTYDPERDYARMKAAGVFKSLGMKIFFVKKEGVKLRLI